MSSHLSGKALKSVILNQATKMLPLELKDLAYNYVFSSTSDRSANIKVLFIAVAKDILNQYLNLFNTVNLRPVLVTADSLALKLPKSLFLTDWDHFFPQPSRSR